MPFETGRIALLLAALSLPLPRPTARSSRVNVYPPDINLSTKADLQRFIVVATRDDGVTLDVTSAGRGQAGRSEALQARQEHALPAGRRPDDARNRVSGPQAAATVAVKDAAAERPISFQLDVMPVFMRAGCNTGSCHGAARGKDGFRLSLFGFDPQGDYYRLTREIGIRRINLASPDGEPADRKVDRRGAAHRRQAVRRRQRVLRDAAALARSRRSERRRAERPPSSASSSIRRPPCSKAKGRRSSSSPGPAMPTAPTATSRTWPCS